MYLDALEQVAQSGIPGTETAVLIDVGTARYLRFFQHEFIDNGVKKGNSICRFFEGPFGAGKTHLLQLISGLGQDNQFAVARLDLSQALDITEWHHVTKFILQHLTLQDGTGVHKGLPAILTMLSQREDRDKSVDLKQAKLPQPGFGRAMQYMLDSGFKSPEHQLVISRFLSGEKVLVADMKRQGLKGVKGSLNARNADQILKSALNGLFLLGVPTMILLDENERTLAKSAGSNAKYNKAANLMRRLIDACALGGIQGSTIIFTVLPNFIQMCVEQYPALGQRLRTVPPDTLSASWRTPVLEVRDVNSATTEEKFLEEAVERFNSIARELGIHKDTLRSDLERAGQEVLQRNAGAGYRRELMKLLASKILRLYETSANLG